MSELPEGAIRVLDDGFIKLVDHMGGDDAIVQAARVSYGKGTKKRRTDRGLIRYLMRHRHCYYGSMEVLTTRGWVKWEDCQQEETFLVPNPRTRTLTKETLPLEVFSVEDETMHIFENNRMSYCVTIDHRMWFRPKEQNGYDIFQVQHMPKWGHFDPLKGYKLYSSDITPCPKAQFIGFYLGDGSFASTNRVSFHLKKQRKIKFLKDLLSKLDLKYTEKQSSTYEDARTFLVETPKWLHDWTLLGVRAKDKSIYPRKIELATNSEVVGLISGLTTSDGSIRSDRPQIQFHSKSVKLLSLFEGLYAKIGIDAHRTGNNISTAYLGKRTSLEARKQYFRTETFTGKVFCTTTSTGLLMVRGGPDKFAFVCGNTTPFEMCEIKFHVRVPMDCWRQWIRHRTANVNEYSTRYSVAIDAAQRTASEQWRIQAQSNRQGSDGYANVDTGRRLTAREAELQTLCRTVYEERLAEGIAREQARKDLPLSTYCYDDQTEVLTDRGFIAWPAVLGTDKLGIWDPIQNTLCYESPDYLTADKYKGPMYRVNHRGIDLLVTPHHKMWVRRNIQGNWSSPELIPAENLGHKSLVRYIKAAPYNVHDKPLDIIRFTGLDLPYDKTKEWALLELIGFFIGDGHAPLREKNALVFNLRKKRKIEYLTEVCKRLGLVCELRSNQHYIVRHKGIAPIFRELFYDSSGQKRIPYNLVRKLICDQAKMLCSGLKNSDGYEYGRQGSWRYVTTSKQVGEATAILGVHAGCAVNGPYQQRRKDGKNQWIVSFFGRGVEPVINQMSRNTSYEDYNSIVYCAKTRTGILVVRRNGKICLSGNTEAYWKCDLHNIFHFLQLRMHPHAQKEIREYANAMYELIKPIYPLACEAFEDYRLNGVTLSHEEITRLRLLVAQYPDTPGLLSPMSPNKKGEDRELDEFKKKIGLADV